MKYNGFTNAGSVYQAKCKANELPIKFVKVKIGNGLLEETEDPAKFMDVKNLKKEVGISEKTQIQDAVRLTIQMDNDGVTEGYFPREFGIYVEDEGVEVLYWYVNDGNEASYLPSQSTAPVKLKNHFNIIATSLESLVVNWSGKEFWIDKEYLEKELEKKQDMTDGKLLTAAKTIWGSINELFTKKANKDDVENNLITVDEGKILDARQGPAIVNKINGLAGGYSGTFPLTTAVKEGIYLLPATNKFYVCVENYSGSSLTAPNANFEELSVFQNRNKLENFFKILYDGAGIESFDISAYQQYNYFLVNVFTYKSSLYDGTSTYLIPRKSSEDNLDKFGFFMPSGQYNYIYLKNNIIEKMPIATVSTVQIKTIIAFS